MNNTRLQALLEVWLKEFQFDNGSYEPLYAQMLALAFQQRKKIVSFYYTTNSAHQGIPSDGIVRPTICLTDQWGNDMTFRLQLDGRHYRELIKRSIAVYRDAEITTTDSTAAFMDRIGIFTGNHHEHLFSDVCFANHEIRMVKTNIAYKLNNPCFEKEENNV